MLKRELFGWNQAALSLIIDVSWDVLNMLNSCAVLQQMKNYFKPNGQPAY